MSALIAIQEAFADAEMVDLPAGAFERMVAYLEVLIRWNERLNLTAIRTPAEMINRHLVECGLLAKHLAGDVSTLMDYGSGAGLPGIVVAILRPEILVTLAEAQGKKASFLREVIRSLDLRCEVYEGRVEAMPAQQIFDAVSMRAVERMEEAISIAARHVQRYLFLLTTEKLAAGYRSRFSELEWQEDVRIRDSEHRVIASAVPRGTGTYSVPRGTD